MGKGTIMKVKFPLLVLLGIVFLASATVSFGLAYREKENPISHNKCLQNHGRCKLVKNHQSEEWEGREEQHESRQPWRERGSHESEEEEERDPREQPRPRHQEQEQKESEGQRGRGEEEEEEEPYGQQHQSQREREREPRRRSKEQGRRGRGEEEGGEEEESKSWRRQPQSQREKEQERQQSGRGSEQEEEKGEARGEEKGEARGERRREDPEERERLRRREPRQREERGQRPEKREQREERGEGQGSQSQSQRRNNPFHFSSNKFQTRYKNRNGQIRVLQRFDQRSSKLQNLQNYRIVEYESKPSTLVLPHHSDAEYILVVLKGRATVTVVMSNDKQAYNLESGDVLRLPAGTTAYILNRDDNQNLRVVKLAIPVNKPGQFDDFFPSSTENQQSYFLGFSRNTLEAAFNTRYEEIQRILLGDEEQEQEQEQEQQSQEEGVIVKVSKEQIKELTRHAQSSSRRGKHNKHSESGPFNLRNNKPVYSNKFGNFYEITPDKNPQLEDLELSLSYVEINEGALMLPHYNSEAIEIVVVSEGKGNIELVGLREQQQQQQEQQEEEEEQQEEHEEEEGNRQVQRYRARLSPSDTFVIPAGYPVSVNASSDLYLLGFGINAENNQRNFLAGEDDNVISQLDRQVKEIAFPGSAQDVEWLINNQQQSYFASAQPQQSGEGRQHRRGPLSSILAAFY